MSRPKRIPLYRTDPTYAIHRIRQKAAALNFAVFGVGIAEDRRERLPPLLLQLEREYRHEKVKRAMAELQEAIANAVLVLEKRGLL